MGVRAGGGETRERDAEREGGSEDEQRPGSMQIGSMQIGSMQIGSMQVGSMQVGPRQPSRDLLRSHLCEQPAGLGALGLEPRAQVAVPVAVAVVRRRLAQPPPDEARLQLPHEVGVLVPRPGVEPVREALDGGVARHRSIGGSSPRASRQTCSAVFRAATVAAALLAIAFGAIAMLAGAISGRRAVAVGAPAAAAVAAYLVSSLAAIVDALRPLRQASPFYHFVASDPLRSGLELGHAGFLVALTAVAAVAAVVAFDRRDLAA